MIDHDNGKGQEDEYPLNEPPAYNGPRDYRATYTLQVRRAFELAIRQTLQNPLFANRECFELFNAALSATSVMAFLLKCACDKRVTGLEVSSLEIKEEAGLETIGTLPYVVWFSFVLLLI
jgi:hypothetical protein